MLLFPRRVIVLVYVCGLALTREHLNVVVPEKSYCLALCVWPVVVVLKYGFVVLHNREDVRLGNIVSVTLCD